MRALIVEDDRKIASFLVQGLLQAGWAVDQVHTAEDALDLAAAAPFDAAIVAPLKGAYADLRELTDMDFGYLFDPSLTFDEVLDCFLATHVTQYAQYQAGCRRLRERVAEINRTLSSAVAAF